MKTLVVSPHPDDEVLGCGGTIARLAKEGNDITVAIVTKGWQPLYDSAQVEQVRSEAKKANDFLGVNSLRFMDLPVTKLDSMEKHQINKAFDNLVVKEQPELIFLPFPNDRHEDHTQIFDACMVALRPTQNRNFIKKILCYETVSETHWSTPYLEQSFDPNLWIDISKHLSTKLDAMSIYKSQLQPPPQARSKDALSALAKWRGSIVGMHAAECFITIRDCWT